MQTRHIELINGQSAIVKSAQDKKDLRILALIKKNLNYINICYPDITQNIISYEKDQLILEKLPGLSNDSISAVEFFSDNEWGLDEILKIIKTFELKRNNNVSLFYKSKLFLRPLLRGIYWGTKIIPDVISAAIKMLFSKTTWVDSHGDFTVYNILIERSTKVARIIDWESFGIRSKYYDLLMLIYNQCTPISMLSWQVKIAEKYENVSNISANEYKNIRNQTIFILYLFYLNEIIRKRNCTSIKVRDKYPGSDYKYFCQRAEIRLANLFQVLKTSNSSQNILFWREK